MNDSQRDNRLQEFKRRLSAKYYEMREKGLTHSEALGVSVAIAWREVMGSDTQERSGSEDPQDKD